MELEVIINWIMAASITLIGVCIGWYLNQRNTVKAEERRNKREREIGINRISQHLVGFTVIAERFKQFDKKDSIEILEKDLQKWVSKLEVLFANFAHLDFMPGFYTDSQYVIGKIEFIFRESTERNVQEYIKRNEIIRHLNDIRKDTNKYLKRLGKLFND